MVALRILRSPLTDQQNQSILDQYNHLTAVHIPMTEFIRWVQDGPAGPAWHALLETEDGQIAGHTSLIPLRATFRGMSVTAAKSEYSFVRPEFRSAKIQGFEKTARPRFLILVDQLFRHCAALGWGPFLISTTPALHKLGPRVECYPVEFPLHECLLILRGFSAARWTPNLSSWQRAGIAAAGACQAALWRTVWRASTNGNGPHSGGIDAASAEDGDGLLAFFQDKDSLRWRYVPGQYDRLTVGASHEDCVIVKNGGGERYLRVCQWRLMSSASVEYFVKGLVSLARAQKAPGVRWAVYGQEPDAQELVGNLRRLGFLCVARTRTELIHSHNQGFRTASAWKLNDAMFSFDP